MYVVHIINYLDGPESEDVRLSSGRYGQVEVFRSGMWQPIADINVTWTMENTGVVCRQLGYAPYGLFVIRPLWFVCHKLIVYGGVSHHCNIPN